MKINFFFPICFQPRQQHLRYPGHYRSGPLPPIPVVSTTTSLSTAGTPIPLLEGESELAMEDFAGRNFRLPSRGEEVSPRHFQGSSSRYGGGGGGGYPQRRR